MDTPVRSKLMADMPLDMEIDDVLDHQAQTPRDQYAEAKTVRLILQVFCDEDLRPLCLRSTMNKYS